MEERWALLSRKLPHTDRADIEREVPQANGGVTIPLTDRNQLNAEYAQSCYIQMRRLEKNYTFVNYFDPE